MTVQEIRDWYRVRDGYSFRPKLFGWGAVPVTWEGWLVTFGLIAVAVPVAWVAQARDLWLLLTMLPLILAYVWLCRTKTDGDWKWRWGSDR
jgi:hypothetical protein